MWSVFRFSHVKAQSISHFLDARVLPWREKKKLGFCLACIRDYRESYFIFALADMILLLHIRCTDILSPYHEELYYSADCSLLYVSDVLMRMKVYVLKL